MKNALYVICVLLSAFVGGAFAQTVGGGVQQALGNVFASVWTQNGASLNLGNTYAAQLWELSSGTNASPVTTAGPLHKISRTENMTAAPCNANKVDNECNAALAVYAKGLAGSAMQTNALFVGATGAPSGTDVFAINAWSFNTGATGTGSAGYFEGRRTQSTANANGLEARSANFAGVDGSYNPTGFSNTTGLWISSSGNSGATKSGVAASICGLGSCIPYDVGYATPAGAVVSQSFRDDSSSVTTMMVNGSHTNGIDMSGASLSGAPIIAPLLTPGSSSAACAQGSVKWDASFIYICTATNTWKRATLATF